MSGKTVPGNYAWRTKKWKATSKKKTMNYMENDVWPQNDAHQKTYTMPGMKQKKKASNPSKSY